MKSLIASLAAALTLVGCTSCITMGQAQKDAAPPSDKDLICATANEYVESSEAAANQDTPDKTFESEVEACGLIASSGLGYATYHINGYDKASGKFLGHMKRMVVYMKKGAHWVAVDEGTIAFLPPLNSEPVTPPAPQSTLEL